MTNRRISQLLSVFVFFVVSVLFASHSRATNYYIDSVGGNDGNSGTSTNTPWKSHEMADSTTMVAGDTVHFKNGSSFTGAIAIAQSGTAANPITLTSYGTGEAPKFTNKSESDMNGNCIRLNGDYIIVEKLHFLDTPGDSSTYASYVMRHIGAIRILRYADHCIIRNNTFMRCPQGIASQGEYTLITSNHMDRGLNAPALWRSANSSWGPMGIHLNIGNQEVSYNTIKNYGTTDSPWGSDGGAIEIDYGASGYLKHNIYIHHNYSEGNAGFIESSWDYDYPQYGQEVHNWRISFNVCYDGQSWLFMLAPCTGVYFDNNTVARYNTFGRSQNWGARMDVQGGTPVGVAAGAHFRNNLFIYTGEDNPYQGNRADGAQKSGNWYMRIDSPGRACTGDANQIGSGDPKLKNLTGGNYKLMPDSPLIGRAANLSAVYTNAVDFNGQPLPTNGNWDVGAMQYIFDDDGDGMADSWEFNHGLNISTNDAAAHRDSDGASNYEEYLADTHPTNTLSVFKLSILGSTNMVLSWDSSTLRQYSLWCSTNITDTGSWTPVSQMTHRLGTGGTMVYTNTVTDLCRFFKVSVSLPE